jgi:hypothetical protein
MELQVEFELACSGWDPESEVTHSVTAECEQRANHGTVSSGSPERSADSLVGGPRLSLPGHRRDAAPNGRISPREARKGARSATFRARP